VVRANFLEKRMLNSVNIFYREGKLPNIGMFLIVLILPKVMATVMLLKRRNSGIKRSQKEK
jgi:hypothetical protein